MSIVLKQSLPTSSASANQKNSLSMRATPDVVGSISIPSALITMPLGRKILAMQGSKKISS
jgi:hypothetical protein